MLIRRFIPGQTQLNLIGLDEGFFGDGQRFHKYGGVADGRRHRAHIARLIHHEFRHETMHVHDAVFVVEAGHAEIGPMVAAGGAGGIVAGPAHGGDDQVAGIQTANLRPGFNHLGETFVTEHQVIGARRRRAEHERCDLTICRANAHLQHAQFHARSGFELRFRQIVHNSQLACAGKNGRAFHSAFTARRRMARAGAPSAPTHFSGRQTRS